MSDTPFIDLIDIAKHWDGQLGAEDLLLDIEDGALAAPLVPLGIRKLTSHRAVAGLELPDEMTITNDDRDVMTGTAPDQNLWVSTDENTVVVLAHSPCSSFDFDLRPDTPSCLTARKDGIIQYSLRTGISPLRVPTDPVTESNSFQPE